MAQITIYFRDISRIAVLSEAHSLLEILISTGIPIEGACGGRGKCGKCAVEVLDGTVYGKDGKSIRPVKGGPNWYLACQAYGSGDLSVRVPDFEVATGKVVREGSGHRDVDPTLKRHRVKVERPTLKDPRSFQETVLAALEPGFTVPATGTLSEMSVAVDQGHGALEVFTHRKDIIHVAPGRGKSNPLGLALDIGTTTIAGMLADLSTGLLLVSDVEGNSQMSHGADVISRIIAASTAEGLARLHDLVIASVNVLIKRICSKAKVSPEGIYSVTAAGNSTMSHLFAGVSPATLGTAPYVPVFKYAPLLRARDLGILVHEAAVVEILPAIGGFVGSDTVAAILATRQDLSDEMILLIDLGTNGEIVLGNRDGMIAASTAAGPAFEGVHITCGMRAVPGAIDGVSLTDQGFTIHTVEGAKPRGLCGSGLLDTVTLLLSLGVLDGSGRLRAQDQLPAGAWCVKNRIREGEKGREFVLVLPEDSGTGEPITLSQTDVREVQLAKGAVAAGIKLLMEERGVSPKDIKRVNLAGAFGNSINRDSAAAIGLVPGVSPDRFYSVGNAAGYGAFLALLSEAELERAGVIARTMGRKELAAFECFQKEFFHALSFPGPQEKISP